MNEELKEMIDEAIELHDRFLYALMNLIRPTLREKLFDFRKIVEKLEEMKEDDKK